MSDVTKAEFLSTIDWERPWLTHIRVIGERIAQAADWRVALNQQAQQQAIRNHQGLPLQFVPQTMLPQGMAYEAFISATGQVPTRDNLHDFFNALVWLTFPATKAQLNALQATEIAKASMQNGAGFAHSSGCSSAHVLAHVSAHASSNASSNASSKSCGKSRGKLRDGATIFDENSVLLVTSNLDLVGALRAHAWEDVFVMRREIFQQTCQTLLFGHALMEKLIAPYKAITGHVWVVDLMPETTNASIFSVNSVNSVNKPCSFIDVSLAQKLQGGLTTADFSPLPVLGVPGWWNGQDDAFYQDHNVFRPKRK